MTFFKRFTETIHYWDHVPNDPQKKGIYVCRTDVNLLQLSYFVVDVDGEYWLFNSTWKLTWRAYQTELNPSYAEIFRILLVPFNRKSDKIPGKSETISLIHFQVCQGC